MSDDLRALLGKVAAGEIDPETASRMMDRGGSPSTAPIRPAHSPAQAASSGRASSVAAEAPPEHVIVRAEGVRLTIHADPSVSSLVVDGPHSIVRDGPVLRLNLGRSAGREGYSFDRGERDRAWRFWVPASLAQGHVRVAVRVNPALPLDIDALASQVEVTGAHAPLVIRASSASLRVREHAGHLDAVLMMCSGDFEVRLREGASRVSADMSSATVRVMEGSDVRAITRAEMGSVKLVGGKVVVDRETGGEEAVVGQGTATLAVNVRMGSAKVLLP